MDIQEYLTQDGQSPFDLWLCGLRERMLLLTGGDKGSQRRHIQCARDDWLDYRNRRDG